MGYGPSRGSAQNATLENGYAAPGGGSLNRALPNGDVLIRGNGYLAGEFPDGITKIEGVPGPATIRILYRPGQGFPGDGMVVAEVQSAADGTWRVDGLDPAMQFDVVCRHGGYNDSILSNVTPATEL